MKKKAYFYLLGAITGVANGLFGSGGGIIAVPMLQKAGMPVKNSHAASLALTLPLSVISACVYVMSDVSYFYDALKLIPLGLIGAAAGAILLKRIPNAALKRIFGVILIAAGGKILFFS